MADAQEEFFMFIDSFKSGRSLRELAATMGRYKAKHVQSAGSLGKRLTSVLRTEPLRSAGSLVSVYYKVAM